jgi:hypothetical protein
MKECLKSIDENSNMKYENSLLKQVIHTDYAVGNRYHEDNHLKRIPDRDRVRIIIKLHQHRFLHFRNKGEE